MRKNILMKKSSWLDFLSYFFIVSNYFTRLSIDTSFVMISWLLSRNLLYDVEVTPIAYGIWISYFTIIEWAVVARLMPSWVFRRQTKPSKSLFSKDIELLRNSSREHTTTWQFQVLYIENFSQLSFLRLRITKRSIHFIILNYVETILIFECLLMQIFMQI